MKNNFIEIIPSLSTSVILGIFLLYFAFKKNTKGIVFTTFIFFPSVFTVQIITQNSEVIKRFANEYNNVFSFPLVTIIGTALGIFSGNQLLYYLRINQQRREKSVLIVKAIDSHITNLKAIDTFVVFELFLNNLDYINIYQSDMENNKIFEIAFNEIGIYEENLIDLISNYYTNFKKCLNELNLYILNCKNGERISITYTILKIHLNTLALEGLLCTYVINSKYTSKKQKKVFENFISDYYFIMNKLINKSFKPELYHDHFVVISGILSTALINKLNYIKLKFQENSNFFNSLRFGKTPIYLCRAFLVVIANDVDFVNHNLVNSGTINEKDCVIAYGCSEEESVYNCHHAVKFILSSGLIKIETIDDFIKKTQFES